MEGQVVFQGKTKNGKDYVIRYPAKDDGPLMQTYINSISKEQTFIRFQGEEISLEDEQKYLEGQLERIKNNKTVQLFVVCDNQIVGIAGIDLKDKSESHEGVLGISLYKEYRGEGIGKKLMSLIIDEAISNLSQLKLITLGVFGNNTLALDMYKKFGFQEYGRLPQGSTHKGQYVDHVYMYKKVTGAKPDYLFESKRFN